MTVEKHCRAPSSEADEEAMDMKNYGVLKRSISKDLERR